MLKEEILVSNADPVEKAKDRLARAMVRLERAVGKRVEHMDTMIAEARQANQNIVSSELTRALHEEINRLKKENIELLKELKASEGAYTSLKKVSEAAISTIDNTIEDLFSLSAGKSNANN